MNAELVGTLTEVEVARRRFTVAELIRLSDMGFLGDDERIELIQGEIVEMSPINVPHASTVNRLNTVLSRLFAHRGTISVQNPVQLDNETLLQPDITVLRPRDDFYSMQHPSPEDVLLVIEVSDSTLQYDRRVKRRLYGAASIIEYWLVDLTKHRIEVYREPQIDGYRSMTLYSPGETLSPLAFPDISLYVADILG
jgi:Uma2 family endonuclease